MKIEAVTLLYVRLEACFVQGSFEGYAGDIMIRVVLNARNVSGRFIEYINQGRFVQETHCPREA
jgi:hypothetical protein